MVSKAALLRSIEWHDLPVDELTVGIDGVSMIVTPFDDEAKTYRDLRFMIRNTDRIRFSGGTLENADLSGLEVSSLAYHHEPDGRLSGTLTVLLASAGIWEVEFTRAEWDLVRHPPVRRTTRATAYRRWRSSRWRGRCLSGCSAR